MVLHTYTFLINSRGVIFPGIYYSYLHPYLTLLPILSTETLTIKEVCESLVKLSEDLEDISFMLHAADQTVKCADLSLERFLLYFLSVVPQETHQLIALQSLFFLTQYWTSFQYSQELFPKLISLYPMLYADEKLLLFKIFDACKGKIKSQDTLIAVHLAHSFYEKLCDEKLTMVRTIGLVKLMEMLPKQLDLSAEDEKVTVHY